MSDNVVDISKQLDAKRLTKTINELNTIVSSLTDTINALTPFRHKYGFDALITALLAMRRTLEEERDVCVFFLFGGRL